MMIPTLKRHYLETVVPELIKTYSYANIHQVPVIRKVVLNSGLSSSHDKAWIQDVAKDIGLICGQKSVLTRARKSISNFKLRQGMPIGAMVTLRGPRMYQFLERFLAVALPNQRDFQGLPRKFDGRGNYNVGISDHSIFPEINVEHGRSSIGFDVTIVTSANTDEEGRDLLRMMGFPFRKPSGS
jgi:large subunit ribosomal protein L5